MALSSCVYTASPVFIGTYAELRGYTRAVPSIRGRRIVQLRKAAGFDTQGALAVAAQMDPSKLSKLENDKRVNLTLTSIERLAAALNVSVRALFDEPRPEESGHERLGGGHETSAGADSFFDAFRAIADREDPAADSLEGDVLKAAAILNRAVQRIGRAGAHRRASGDVDG